MEFQMRLTREEFVKDFLRYCKTRRKMKRDIRANQKMMIMPEEEPNDTVIELLEEEEDEDA